MKAITIKQPWASLIVSGLKDIENRSWKTSFRGRVLIHAGMKADNHWSAPVPICDKVDEFLREISKSGTDWSNYHFGAIIGSVEIVDCVQNHPSIWAEKGAWNWISAIKSIMQKRGLTKMSSKILEIRPSATEQEIAEIILDFWISNESWTRYEFGHLRSLDLFEQQTK